jgi:ATP-dependent DNA helicase RecQ
MYNFGVILLKFLLSLLFNDAIVTEDVETFELGAFLPPNKEEILTVLHQNYTFKDYNSLITSLFTYI